MDASVLAQQDLSMHYFNQVKCHSFHHQTAQSLAAPYWPPRGDLELLAASVDHRRATCARIGSALWTRATG